MKRNQERWVFLKHEIRAFRKVLLNDETNSKIIRPAFIQCQSNKTLTQHWVENGWASWRIQKVMICFRFARIKNFDRKSFWICV